jgi:hypothetical protein
MVKILAAFAMLASCALKTDYLFRVFAQQDMFATSREQKGLSNHVPLAFFAQLAQQQLTHFVVMKAVQVIAPTSSHQ